MIIQSANLIKKVLLLSLVFVLLLISPVNALKTETHEAINEFITRNTLNIFSLDAYLKEQLGMYDGIENIFNSKEVYKWLRLGGSEEDRVPRFMNHFHHPITNKGLYGISHSAVEWTVMDIGTQNLVGADYYSWYDVRDYFHKALTSADKSDSDYFFTRTFQGLGQLMHLVQDMSVPEHTRDDGHPVGFVYEGWVLNNVNVANYGPIFFDHSALKETNPLVPELPVINLFDTDTYNGTNPGATLGNAIGLSEYTNANFLSPDTMFLPHPNYPYPSAESAELWVDPDNNRQYLRKTKDGEPVAHLAAVSFWFPYRRKYFPREKTYLPVKLDTKCYEEYSDKLLPRAIGYSAGLLEYFFRGRLEITAPDAYVYSIVDGSETVVINEIEQQVFNTIKTKVRNITSEETSFDEQIQSGTIQAIARYKIWQDYQPNLSADPPPAEMMAVDYSYAVSKLEEVASLEEPEAFEFDFSENPIPVGITDLCLLVIFKGTLGDEEDIAIAVGMKDLNEPTHIAIMNCTDRFYLDGVLRRAEEISKDPVLNARAHLCECLIDPHNVHMKVGFYAMSSAFDDYHAQYASMPAGRYGKVIILTDEPQSYMRVHTHYDEPPEDVIWVDTVTSVTNQEKDGIFHVRAISSFRGINQHHWAAYTRFFPNTSGISTAPWSALEDDNKEPVSADMIAQ